ncbi:MAG: PASTA domain-containing protein [Gemmatimonadetes bacterium]|nr:PASTA domain-containing protein [Gemmatimonadota bacterium]
MTRFGIHGDAAATSNRDGIASGGARTHTRRHRCLAVGVTLVATLYAVRLADLQIVRGSEHRETQLAQSATWDSLPAPRGSILDRRGEVLASHDTRHLAYVPVDHLSGDREATIDRVAEIVDVSAERRRAVLDATHGWPLIASGVRDEERVRLENELGRNIRFESASSRAYPAGSVGRRLIGGVAADGSGRTGLERNLDPLLRGVPGRAEVRFDGHNNSYRPPGGDVVEPRAGHAVVLTIDAELQRIAETALAAALVETGARAGDIVLLDPRTGELLAVASERTGSPPDQVPAFTEPYEPGSTLKPFLLASLLNEGRVELDETIDVEDGVYRTGLRTIRDVHEYDELSVRDVIAKSSNVGAAKLAARLEPRVQHRYLRDFGLGMRTQVEGLNESAGRLDRPDNWTAFSPASHAIGYEVSATSIQLVAAYAALANGGVLMQPQLVREVRDADGRVVRRFEPRPVRRVVRPEVAAQVTRVLESVVEDGTGTLAQMSRIAVAGKTGTARLAADGGYAQGRYRASFVGFAPADDPRVVILTRLEDPSEGSYYGGAIAAPTSQATLQAALATDGVQIDPRLVVRGAAPRPWAGRAAGPRRTGPFIFAVGSSEEPWHESGDAHDSIAVPNLRGLSPRSAAARLHELGLRAAWMGAGTVEAQRPPAGRPLKRGGTVVLR